MKRLVVICGMALCLLPLPAHAQIDPSAGVSQPLVLMLALAALALAPFVVMMATSFVKLAVVFALIRNALGTQQIPPNTVVTGLALIMTVYIMMPIGHQAYTAAAEVIHTDTNQPIMSQATVKLLGEGVTAAKEPIRGFLIKHTHKKDRALFFQMAKKMETDEKARANIADNDMLNLVPAFAISELAESFQIGFVIFLPFLIIDLVIANILLSLGMFQISPITISLPFKLLLFVLVDGWHMIAKGLIVGYA